MRVDYSTTQLDPDELGALVRQREAEARAQAARDFDRPLGRGGMTRNGPRTLADAERARAEEARWAMIGPEVRTPQRGGPPRQSEARPGPAPERDPRKIGPRLRVRVRER